MLWVLDAPTFYVLLGGIVVANVVMAVFIGRMLVLDFVTRKEGI